MILWILRHRLRKSRTLTLDRIRNGRDHNDVERVLILVRFD